MSQWRSKGAEIDNTFGERSVWRKTPVHNWTDEQRQIIQFWKEGGEKQQHLKLRDEAGRASSTTKPPTIEQFMSQVKAEEQKEVLEPVQSLSAIRSEKKTEPRENLRFKAERRKQVPESVRRQPSTQAGLRVESKEGLLVKLKSERKLEGIGFQQSPALPRMMDGNSKDQTHIAGNNLPRRIREDLQPRSENVSLSATSQHQPEHVVSTTASSRHTLHPSSKNVAEAPSLRLGLKNITMLFDKLGNPQDRLKVVHVAGTNGKGSVCAYLTSCLTQSKLRVGQFTSPHLIDRWDCITIDGKVVPTEVFLEIERDVKEISNKHAIGASSFEILVACAVIYFSQQKVDLAVIEAGMGGLLDATNVFKVPLVSVITPISIDHTQYLGSTIEDIARHKAGIIKPGSAVVSAPQPPAALQVLQQTAIEADAHMRVASGRWRTPAQTRYIVDDVHFRDDDPLTAPLTAPLIGVVPGIAGSRQSDNIACAVKALDILRIWFPQISEDAVQKGVANASVPGRMEWVRLERPEGRLPMLLDGAHNPSSCEALAEFVGALRREAPVIWVVSFSRGRNLGDCLGKLVKNGDSVACVEFGEVDGMSWVKPIEAKEIARYATEMSGNAERVMNFGQDIRAAINWAVTETKERRGMLVGTGSLYLVGEIHRLKRDDPEFM